MSTEHSDIETRLRGLAQALPEPMPAATVEARGAVKARFEADHPVHRSWRPFLVNHRRGLLVAATVTVASAAVGAIRWTTRDVPPGGKSASAFVLPATDILPGGHVRTRPPRYTELPPRPSLMFPVGTTYRDALRAYYSARQQGKVIPSDVTLSDPLPAGRIVQMTADGRVAVDPAAPAGYDLWTGLVGGFVSTPTVAPALPRCQVLLAGQHSSPADCAGNPNRAPFVREVAGRWQTSPTEVSPPTRIVGSSTLAVLHRPRAPHDELPRRLATSLALSLLPGVRLNPGQSRLGLVSAGVRYFVVPAGDGNVCLIADEPGGPASTCNPPSVLVTFGAIPLNTKRARGQIIAAGLVGDGFSRVTTPDGRSSAIPNNVFSIPATEGDKLTLSGPAGTHRISVL